MAPVATLGFEQPIKNGFILKPVLFLANRHQEDIHLAKFAVLEPAYPLRHEGHDGTVEQERKSFLPRCICALDYVRQFERAYRRRILYDLKV